MSVKDILMFEHYHIYHNTIAGV